MERRTRELWAKQDQHEGDRQRLFTAVGAAVDAADVLYAGSYVDIAPSFVFPSVTYLDTDDRARRFFDDEAGVRELIEAHRLDRAAASFRFIHADYTDDVGLEPESFDLLVSLYAGFVSEHCTRHLRVGGTLLVNSSHGDAAMASIDARYELAGVVTSRSGDYRVSISDLDTYLVPKAEQSVTVEGLHEAGRGVAYTRSPFAYLFTRIT